MFKKKKGKREIVGKKETILLFSQLHLINNLCLNLLFRILFHVILLIPRCLIFVAASICVVVIVSQPLCI